MSTKTPIFIIAVLCLCAFAAGPVSADVLFTTDWESGAESWTTSGSWALGSGLGAAPGAFSADNYWFAEDRAGPSSDFLTSPDYAVPAGATDLVLTFEHRYDMEAGFDGGVIEVSVNGGGYTYVPAGIPGPLYDDTISSSFSSPIGGLDAYTDDMGGSAGSAGYMMETVDLFSYAGPGDTISIRFHQADDSSVDDDGWYIDDLSLSATVIPEPSTITFLLLSLCGMGCLRRR